MFAAGSSVEPTGGWSLFGLVIVGVLSTTVLVSMPVLAPALADHVGGGVDAIGYLSSADWFGSVLAGVVGLFCVERISWRFSFVVCLFLATIANLLCLAASSFEFLFLARFFVGVANGGVLAIVFVALCHTRSPDRAFGFYVFAQLALQSLVIPVFSWLLSRYGPSSLFVALAVMPIISLPFLLFAPKNFEETGALILKVERRLQIPVWAWAVLAALAVYFIAPIMVWSYFEPIGQGFSISGPEIGAALGLSAFAGMAGAAIVLWLNQEEKRSLMIISGVLLSTASVIILALGSGYALFLLGASIFNFAWNYTFPYLMGVVAKFDETGEVAILGLVAQILGIALGPAVGGFLVGFSGGVSVVLMVSLVIYLISALVFLRANKQPTLG